MRPPESRNQMAKQRNGRKKNTRVQPLISGRDLEATLNAELRRLGGNCF